MRLGVGAVRLSGLRKLQAFMGDLGFRVPMVRI